MSSALQDLVCPWSLTLISCSLFIFLLRAKISRCQSVDCAKIEAEIASGIPLTSRMLKSTFQNQSQGISKLHHVTCIQMIMHVTGGGLAGRAGTPPSVLYGGGPLRHSVMGFPVKWVISANCCPTPRWGHLNG